DGSHRYHSGVPVVTSSLSTPDRDGSPARSHGEPAALAHSFTALPHHGRQLHRPSDALYPGAAAAHYASSFERAVRPYRLRVPVRHDVRRVSHGLSHGPLGSAPRSVAGGDFVVGRHRRTNVCGLRPELWRHSLLDGSHRVR